jgi:eukaryotic-like serine/threonine-protein kinase
MIGVGAEGNASPLPGAKPFGKYYLLDRIGAGGMAEVFLAVALGPEGFQRTMVIKRMLPHLSQDRAFVRMFVDEAKLCGLLSHPNLVQIFEFGSIEDSFFIAMEHVQGETLSTVRAKLAEAQRVAPVAASLDIARQVCLGLQHAHSLQSATGQPLGIIHRDISPSNLMLSFHGGVKILDFGIARVAEELRETRTQAGTMKGKVSYMSPEQIRMEPVDCRADIFAIGVVLHEMLTGRRLFKATNEFTGARMVLESVIEVPSTVNAEVSPEVDRVVMRALERNRDARYLTAGEMAEDLEKLLFDMRASPHAPRKLLLSLFPQGPSRRSELNLPLTPSPLLIASGEFSPTPSPAMQTQPPPSMPTRDLISNAAPERLLMSGPTTLEGRRTRRRPVVAIVLLGAVAGIAVLALPHRTATPPEVTVAPVAAAAQPPQEPTPPPAPPAKATIDVSLDSSPQDAQVIREDSGEVVGRTPFTITLPQGRDVISFRFEKPGHAPISYRVIPDLDKSVRAELTVEPATDRHLPKHPPASHGSAAAHGRPTANHGARAGGPEPAAPSADQPRDCLLSVASFPWADLWIDGKDTGQRTPVVHYPVSCGAHKLNLKRRDLRLDRVEQVTVAPGHELKQHYELSDEYGD